MPDLVRKGLLAVIPEGELLDAAPDAIIVVDASGCIVLVNLQTERIFGYPRAELVGQQVEMLVPARYRARHPGHRAGFFRDAHTRPMGSGLDLWGLRKDGTEFPVEISLSPVKARGGMVVSAAIRDVTERRAAESKFRSLLEAAPDAIVIVNPRGDIVIVNAQTERLFGYDRNELVGRKVELLIPARFHGVHPGHRNRYFQDPKVRGMGANLELYGRRKDGSEFPVEISLSPMETESGTLVTSAIRDITGRQRLEADLRRSRDLLASAERSAHYGSFEIDVATMAVQVSDGFRAVFGLPSEAEKGLADLTEMVVEDDRSGAEDVTRQALTQVGSRYFRYRLRRGDGEIRPFDVLMETFPGPDGRPARVVGIARDLTEQEKAESRVRESEARFAAFFHNSFIPFTITRLSDGTYFEINDAFTRTLGWTRDDVIGKTSAEVGMLAAATSRRKAVEGVATAGHVSDREVQLRTKDGRVIDVVVSMTKIRSGGEDCIAAGFIDVTERKKAQFDLEQAAAELKQANAELEAFSYSVSHDLRAPLRAMAGFAQILKEDHGTGLSSEARHDLEMILSSAREMARLVDDLLEFSRLGRQPMRRDAVDMNDLARAVVDACQEQAKGRSVHVRLDRLPPCVGDAHLLRQVLANLVDNAFKYTRKTPNARIEIGVTTDGAYYVQDNGVGFDMKHADKLFGVFQRLHRVEDFEGTGVGLATAHRVVARHGGRIWAQAVPDQGATFYFTLGGPDHA